MDLKCSPTDHWDTLGGYLVQTSIREDVLSLFPNVRQRTGKKNPTAHVTAIYRDKMLSYFFHFILQHAGDVQGFTPSVPSYVQWQLELQSTQNIRVTQTKIYPKTIRGTQRILDQMGNSQIPKHLAFQEQHCQSLWQLLQKRGSGPKKQGIECCVRMLQREWKKYSALPSEKEDTPEWVYFSGKKTTILKSKKPSLQPLIIQIFILIQYTNTLRSTEI